MNDAQPVNVSQETAPVTATGADSQPDTAQQPSREDRLEVLELLERGEIDIDEAMSRLEAANESSSPSS